MKSVTELIEAHRDKEKELIKDYIKSVGGDGLVCPGECGCGFDDLMDCGIDFDEATECVPATGKMGEWEGMECMVYTKIEDKTESIHDIDTVKCTCCGAIGPKIVGGAWSFRPPAVHPQLSAWWHHCPDSKCPQANPWQTVLIEHWDEYMKTNNDEVPE